MKIFTNGKVFKLTAMAVAVLILAGCASVNFDQALSSANQATDTFTGGKLELSKVPSTPLPEINALMNCCPRP